VTDRYLPKLLGPLLWRGGGTVQVGADVTRAVVLHGLSDEELSALATLDGTRALPAPRTTPSGAEVLELLTESGLLVDAATPRGAPTPATTLLDDDTQALLRVTTPPARGYRALRARRAAHVLVAGRGALPTALVEVLRRGGVGRVEVGDVAVDARAQTDEPVASRAVPDLVILVARHALDPTRAEPWHRRGVGVLPVVLGVTEGVVGPVVAAARADLPETSPCLHCLDLTRTDLDPAWPALLEQLTRPVVGQGAEVGGEASLVAMVAAMAGMVALGVLDGQPLPPGRSLEVGLPWPGVRQRQWSVHPRCACSGTSRDGAATGRSDLPADASGGPSVRMAG
jgi:hypothetical protein